jgi:hypothetical protein
MKIAAALCAVLFAPILAAIACTPGAGPEASPQAAANDPESDFGDEIRTKTDAQVQASIEAAASGALYVTEADHPFSFVSAKLNGERAVTEALVRAKFASIVDTGQYVDQPLASLYAMERPWAGWQRDAERCVTSGCPGPTECAAMQKLNRVLKQNLRDIKVLFFGASGSPGAVDGTTVNVFVVGRTPQGNLAGVYTVAVWT